MSAQESEVTIAEMAAGGDAVGRDDDGRVTFVRGAAPGERVRVKLRQVKKQFAKGELLEVVRTSPARVEPSCPEFAASRCGGCQWQHLSADAQRTAKRALVENALRDAVEHGMRIDDMVEPVPRKRWRRRARLHWFRPPSSEAAVIGFYAPQSHRVHPFAQCEQLTEGLEAAAREVAEKLGPALHKRGDIWLLEGQGGDIAVAIDGPHAAAAAKALAEVPNVASVRAGRRHHGAPGVAMEDGRLGRADGFEQASAKGNAALRLCVDEVTAGRTGKNVLELYAGGGNFTRILAQGAKEVAAVERHGEPDEILGVEWHLGDVVDVLPALRETGRRFEWAVLDPPRTGAKDALAALAPLGVEHIVYVSCDLATLARDLKVLREHGYKAVSCRPFDLMPQTAHVEAVVTLQS